MQVIDPPRARRRGPRRFLASAALALAALTGAACTDATGLDRDDVEGYYEASRFLVVNDGVTYDVLDYGGSFVLILNDDGTTEGEIVLPDEGGFAEFVDLEGEYEVRDGRVYIETFEDTFLNDQQGWLRIDEGGRQLEIRYESASGDRVIADLERDRF